MEAQGTTRLEGTVRWFKAKLGYGFLSHSHFGGDIFVHHSQILMDGYRRLQDGESVQFDLVNGPKGLHAKNVLRVLPAPPDQRLTHKVLEKRFVNILT